MKIILVDEKKRLIIGTDKPAYGTRESVDSQAKLWMNTYNSKNPEVKADGWHIIGKPKYREKCKM